MAKERCSTCDEPTVRQESEDVVCINRGCEDHATADLITSCCLASPAPDGQCSKCGTPCDIIPTQGQSAALQVVADLLAGDARDLSPPAPAEAWEGLRSFLLTLGVRAQSIPNPK